MADGRFIDDIDDFFEPGDTLEGQLEDEVLMRDLDWQQEVLLSRRNSREERAWADAEEEARELGLDDPTPDMVASYLRMYEAWELDEVPR